MRQKVETFSGKNVENKEKVEKQECLQYGGLVNADSKREKELMSRRKKK